MSSPIDQSANVKKWMKRKRTRRHCNINSISQPVPGPIVTSSTSSSAGFSGITTEDVEIDLANSLILLSQGGNTKDQVTGTQSDTPTSPPPPIKVEKVEKVEKTERTDKLTSRRSTEATAQPNGQGFECKTCFRAFNSFQALGGHRASHKKPKLASDEQKVQASADTGTTNGIVKLDDIANYKDEIQEKSPLVKPSVLTTTGSKARVHECQICHAEFNTGQALGGHMRRHKPLNGGADSSKNKKDRTGLELDLNFPPSDQEETVQPPPPVFPFEESPPTQLLLGSSTITNCLY